MLSFCLLFFLSRQQTTSSPKNLTALFNKVHTVLLSSFLCHGPCEDAKTIIVTLAQRARRGQGSWKHPRSYKLRERSLFINVSKHTVKEESSKSHWSWARKLYKTFDIAHFRSGYSVRSILHYFQFSLEEAVSHFCSCYILILL